MSLLGQVSRSFRRGNMRSARYARRAQGGSLSLSAPRADGGNLLRVAIWGVLSLLLYQIEAGLLARVPAGVVRIDVAVIFASFFALELGAIEGAVSAFAVGYVADLFVQGPPGLCRFLAVAAWTAVRLGSVRVQLAPRLGSFVFTFLAAVGFELGTLAGLQLAVGAGGPGTIAWLSVVPSAALTALLALPVHRMLGFVRARTGGGD